MVFFVVSPPTSFHVYKLHTIISEYVQNGAKTFLWAKIIIYVHYAVQNLIIRCPTQDKYQICKNRKIDKRDNSHALDHLLVKKG